MSFRLSFTFTIVCLVALPLLAQAQYVLDSIDVGTRWVGSLVYNPRANVVYGAGEQPGAFFAIDCSTNEVVASIVRPYTTKVAYDSIDNKAYCIVRCTSDDDSILVIDGSTHARIGAIPLYWANSMVWDPVVNRLYVAEYEDNSVAVIDCATDSVIKHIQTSPEAWRLYLNGHFRKLYVLCHMSERLCIIDLRTLQLCRTIDLPGFLQAGCYSEAVGKFYCVAGNEIVVIDGAGDTVVASIPVHAPWSLGAAGTLMVSGGQEVTGNDTVYVMDAVADSVSGKLLVEGRVSAFARSEETGLIYCLQDRTGAVTVIAGNGASVVKTLTVGAWPAAALALPGWARLLVGHANSPYVYVIRDSVTGIHEAMRPATLGPRLPVARPNPFRRETTITWGRSMADAGGGICILASDGSRIRELPLRDDGLSIWDGHDECGKEVGTGVYILVVRERPNLRTKVVKLN